MKKEQNMKKKIEKINEIISRFFSIIKWNF